MRGKGRGLADVNPASGRSTNRLFHFRGSRSRNLHNNPGKAFGRRSGRLQTSRKHRRQHFHPSEPRSLSLHCFEHLLSYPKFCSAASRSLFASHLPPSDSQHGPHLGRPPDEVGQPIAVQDREKSRCRFVQDAFRAAGRQKGGRGVRHSHNSQSPSRFPRRGARCRSTGYLPAHGPA